MLQFDFSKANWFQDSEGIHISLLVDRQYANAVKNWCERPVSEKKVLTATLKESRPRSLNANAYLWVLLDKLAEKTRVPKTDIYRSLIKEIGGNNDTICVVNKAVDRVVENWSRNGLGWIAEKSESKLDGCTNVILYYGSSTYDTGQMSRLVDLVVQECQQQGIETMTPQELDALKGAWDG